MPSLNRRTVLAGAVSLVFVPNVASSHASSFKLVPRFQPQRVQFTGYAPTRTVCRAAQIVSSEFGRFTSTRAAKTHTPEFKEPMIRARLVERCRRAGYAC